MGGVKGEFKEIMEKTILRILESVNYDSSNCTKLNIKLVTGMDGSGSYIQRGGKNANIDTKNKLLGKFKLLH